VSGLELNLVVYEILEQVVPGSAVGGTGIILVIVLCSMLITMPLAWLHDMPKPQLDELVRQLGLKADGTLEDLMKERWTAIEPFLPSPSPAAKSTLETKDEAHITDSSDRDSSYASKMRTKLVADAMKNIPFLADTDKENVLKFLMAVKGVHDLHLVNGCRVQFSPGR
jgi:hypothetical protein